MTIEEYDRKLKDLITQMEDEIMFVRHKYMDLIKAVVLDQKASSK